MDWLSEGAVARRVPHGEPHPFLAPAIEGNSVLTIAKRPLVCGGNDLTADFVPVAPDGFDELKRKGPLDVGDNFPISPLTLNRPVSNQHLTGRDEEFAIP